MTRGAIRQVAAERFFHQGYEATTVREIADDLDIRAASIYYHYPDKQQILFELIDSTMTLLTDGVRTAVAARGRRRPTSSRRSSSTTSRCTRCGRSRRRSARRSCAA